MSHRIRTQILRVERDLVSLSLREVTVELDSDGDLIIANPATEA
jgi:hypothetical protein